MNQGTTNPSPDRTVRARGRLVGVYIALVALAFVLFVGTIYISWLRQPADFGLLVIHADDSWAGAEVVVESLSGEQTRLSLPTGPGTELRHPLPQGSYGVRIEREGMILYDQPFVNISAYQGRMLVLNSPPPTRPASPQR